MSERIAKGTLCEPCWVRGIKNKPATRVVGDEYWCDDCFDPTKRRAVSGKSGGYRPTYPPPRSEVVSVSEILTIARGDFQEQWADFFRDLLELPPGKCRVMYPSEGQTLHSLQYALTRKARKNGVRVRMWKAKDRIYIAANDGKTKLKDLRRKAIESARPEQSEACA